MQEAGTAVSHRRPTKERLRLVTQCSAGGISLRQTAAQRPAKVSLIGPDRISQRFDHQASTAVYRSMDEFVADVVAIEREIVESLVDAGCRYVQIDAPGFTAYVDPPSLTQMRARGEDPMQNFDALDQGRGDGDRRASGDVPSAIHFAAATSAACGTAKAATTPSPSGCSPNCRTTAFCWNTTARAPAVSRRCGSCRRARSSYSGSISTKVAEMEKVDDLKRRIDEAAKFIPLEQLAISPQCGFASDVVGNLLSADDQKRKLELVAETARQVWH